ncbi:MAG: hypothetical protein UDB11_10190 [Peptococcaceae bacterium]|nr:hypothetical protein [Peptococcaceae bacterium]
MTKRLKRGWRAVAMLALACVLAVTVAFVGLSGGPDVVAPGPEEYHIYDGREGLQTQAALLNGSHLAQYIDDPLLEEAPYIVFQKGNGYSEAYNMDGYLIFYSEPTDDGHGIAMIGASGDMLARSQPLTPPPPLSQRENPLYSYQFEWAITPYWLSVLQQRS